MPSPEKSALLQTLTVIQIVKNFPAFFCDPIIRHPVHNKPQLVPVLCQNRNFQAPIFLDKSFCYHCLHKVTAGKQDFKKAMYAGIIIYKTNKLRGLSPHANYTDRAAAAGRRS